MQDITRYLIILVTISILMGTFNVIISSNSQNTNMGEETQTLSEEIKSNIADQINSEANMPENYQTQTSAMSEQGSGKGIVLKAFALGFIPFYQNTQGGYEIELEQYGYNALSILQSIIYLMTGILLYLVLINKKT